MLNKRIIQGLKAGDKPKKYADGCGLFIFIPVSGEKIWRMAYSFDHKAKLPTFGEYPQVSLLAARQKGKEAKDLTKSGIGPAERKKATRKKISVPANLEEKAIYLRPLYYPANDAENTAPYNAHAEMADANPHPIHGGRLGAYRYRIGTRPLPTTWKLSRPESGRQRPYKF